MADFGKLLILCGLVLLVAGAAMVLAGRTHVPIGRMPGDIVYRGRNTTVYFPIVTCIVLSIVVSLLLWLVGRFSR